MSRVSRFSSSSAWKLMTKNRAGTDFGAPAITYIKQKNWEAKLGRAINKETNSKPTTWGTIIEELVFDMMPLEYVRVSDVNHVHPKYNFWCGMPDLINGQIVGDIKCPFSLIVFCDKLDCLQDIEVYKKEFPEDYWQHVSNTVLLRETGINITHFEAVIYVPYEKQLPEIRQLLKNNEVNWINYMDNSELPYLIEGNKYQDLNIFKFDVIESDVELLTNNFIKAGKLLEL